MSPPVENRDGWGSLDSWRRKSGPPGGLLCAHRIAVHQSSSRDLLILFGGGRAGAVGAGRRNQRTHLHALAEAVYQRVAVQLEVRGLPLIQRHARSRAERVAINVEKAELRLAASVGIAGDAFSIQPDGLEQAHTQHAEVHRPRVVLAELLWPRTIQHAAEAGEVVEDLRRG